MFQHAGPARRSCTELHAVAVGAQPEVREAVQGQGTDTRQRVAPGTRQRDEIRILRHGAVAADVQRRHDPRLGGHQQPPARIFFQVVNHARGNGTRHAGPVPVIDAAAADPGIQGKSFGGAHPDPLPAVHQHGADLVGEQRGGIRRIVAEVGPGVIRKRQEGDAAVPVTQDELVPAEGEGMHRHVAHLRDGLRRIAGEAARLLVQAAEAFRPGARPDGPVGRLGDVRDVIVRQGVRLLTGPERAECSRTQVIAGQARLLHRDPDQGFLPVGEHIVDLVGRQSLRAFRERTAADAVEAVQAFLRPDPQAALRVEIHADDEAVGQADFLSGDQKRAQAEEKETKAGTVHKRFSF